ncbi:hypothetical protein V1477_006105 [Vespula maculifrons]|uniref:Uncharacterized protein n=1 Tax=Vespula maculifrons TaxID=7453 RepID=A0ABD2CLM3_VESMC
MPWRVYTERTEGIAMPVICYGRTRRDRGSVRFGSVGLGWVELGWVGLEGKRSTRIYSQGKETSPAQTST